MDSQEALHPFEYSSPPRDANAAVEEVPVSSGPATELYTAAFARLQLPARSTLLVKSALRRPPEVLWYTVKK